MSLFPHLQKLITPYSCVPVPVLKHCRLDIRTAFTYHIVSLSTGRIHSRCSPKCDTVAKMWKSNSCIAENTKAMFLV